MKKKFLITLFTILLAALTVACSCNTTLTSPPPSMSPATTPLSSLAPSQSPSGSPGLSPSTSPSGSPNASAGPAEGGFSAEDLTKMRGEIEKLSEVKAATVAAMGDSALIGLEFDDAYQGTLTARITEMVSEKVEGVNPSIKTVHVTVDSTLYKDIDALSKKEGATQAEFDALAKKIEPVS
ncbi:MAG: YhcN/YlaJ family sporulation lipoprotein [Christensenellaceae bacterium]|nr:YhcN/YlaJ family sporulation lipoprotein [Christensenellaceae bacterium]